MCLSISAALVSQNALVPDKDLTCQYEPYLALFSVLKTLSKRSTHKSQCVHLKNAYKFTLDTNTQGDTPRNAHQLQIHVITFSLPYHPCHSTTYFCTDFFKCKTLVLLMRSILPESVEYLSTCSLIRHIYNS